MSLPHVSGLLRVSGLQAGYGLGQVLHGVDLEVGAGEIVALLGRNGSGRSTTAKALMGLLPATGHVTWRGQPILGLPPHTIARLGLGYVPESRDVFPHLTVRENLRLGQVGTAGPWGFDQAWHLFPALREREHVPAGVLSGGEQQMLSLARCLMGNPSGVIVDEPTEGLAPQVVAQVAEVLRGLRAQGLAVLLMEQKLAMALSIADRVLVMGHGRVVFTGTPAELAAQASVSREWLEV